MRQCPRGMLLLSRWHQGGGQAADLKTQNGILKRKLVLLRRYLLGTRHLVTTLVTLCRQTHGYTIDSVTDCSAEFSRASGFSPHTDVPIILYVSILQCLGEAVLMCSALFCCCSSQQVTLVKMP